MKYIIKKDEMGIINYYNLEKQLVMQEYQTMNDTINLYYHNKKITKITTNKLVVDLDSNGNIINADFINGVTAYFANKHHKIIFLDHDGEYLGSINSKLEPITSNNKIYIIDKIINKLNETMPNLIANKYSNQMNKVDCEINNVNDEMIREVVSILEQDNRRSIEKILNDYHKQELRDKKILSLIRKYLSKEEYQNKYNKITAKYHLKRIQLKKRYNYLNERRKLEIVEKEFINNQSKLNKLILEKRDIYNEYLTR